MVLQITADMDFYGDGSGNTLYSRGDRRVFFRERKEKERAEREKAKAVREEKQAEENETKETKKKPFSWKLAAGILAGVVITGAAGDVDVYIHQMIYSFERQPKILTALEDTLKVTDHKMKNCIIAAIQEMQYGTTKDVYRMALKNIEKEYACSRITTLHTFLTQVEEKGGEYKSSLEILRCDADHWVSVSGGNKTHKTDNGNRSSTEFSDGIGICAGYIYL